MDSSYEVVLVDVNVATTNGLNGTHEEEVTEMKTRSKVAVGGSGEGGDDESVKPKVRLTRTAAVAQKANDKDGSDSEKKDKKKNPRGAGDAEEVAAGAAKPVTKEAAGGSSGAAGAKTAAGGATGSASASVASATKAKLGGDEDSSKGSTTTAAADFSKASVAVAVAATATAATPPSAAAASKKKTQERDDDSGINSRASSVSNDDVATPARMRTRSSRASEISSTSTPAYRRGAAARVPISIYEYDAASFDDDLLPPISAACGSKGAGSSSSTKRKAVVYVEEMEDEEAAANSNVEPLAKRRATFLFSAGAGIVTSLLYPLRKLRSGIAAIRPYKGVASAENTSTAADAAGAGHEKSVVEDTTEAAHELMDTSAQTGSETVGPISDPQQPAEIANTCSLM